MAELTVGRSNNEWLSGGRFLNTFVFYEVLGWGPGVWASVGRVRGATWRPRLGPPLPQHNLGGALWDPVVRRRRGARKDHRSSLICCFGGLFGVPWCAVVGTRAAS